MNYLFGHHTVEDFDAWKSYFDQDDDRRQESGIRLVQLFRSVDDPNDVHFLFEVDDPQTMKEFMESEETKQIMEKAGVVSEPHIHVLTGA